MNKMVLYIKAHWLGELPFTMSYAFNFFFMTVTYRFASYFAIPAIGWEKGSLNKFSIVMIVTLGIYLMVWGVVGAWRSSKKVSSRQRDFAIFFGLLLILHTLKYYGALFGAGLNVSLHNF